jgi:hypothetical protein
MRTLLLLVAACGHVTTGASQVPPDAAPDSPSSCPSSVVDRALPSSWVTQGPFGLVADPTGRGAQVWVSNADVPSDASFVLPFKVGDRITGLLFNAYGNGSDAGLKNIELVYQPPGQAIRSWEWASTSAVLLRGDMSSS